MKKILIGFIIGLVIATIFWINHTDISVIPVNDNDYFPVAYSLIMSANRSVHVLMFEAKYYSSYPDSLSNKLLQALVSRSKDIDVKVYVDSLFNQSYSGYEFLKEKGVNVTYGIDNRVSHAKLIIVDGKYVLLGSTNWGYYSLEKNHETNVLIKSEALGREFENYFFKVWNESVGHSK